MPHITAAAAAGPERAQRLVRAAQGSKGDCCFGGLNKGHKMRYALIKNGMVENIIIAEPDFIAAIADDWEHIEPLDTPEEQALNVGIGWTYVAGVFAAPETAGEESAEQTYEVLSRLGFRNRFTMMEKAMIEFAAIDDPAKTPEQRMQSAMLRAILADQRDAKYIDVREDTAAGIQTRAGLDMLETAGLLVAGRAATIANTPIESNEAYKEAL